MFSAASMPPHPLEHARRAFRSRVPMISLCVREALWNVGTLPCRLGLQVAPFAQRRLDARARVADPERRRLSGDLLDEVAVAAGDSSAALVVDLRCGPLPLPGALADQPLPEELPVPRSPG